MPKGFIRVELIITVFVLFLFSILSGLAFLSARVEARDKIRIADISQIQKAVNVFYEENGYYPYQSGDRPANIEDYLSQWPTAPKADGSCSEKQNTYTYSQKAGGEDYALTFCLGRSNGSLRPGLHTLSSNGIN